jgi:peptide chain release factor 2
VRDFSDDLKALRTRLEEARGYLKVDAGRDQLVELEAAAADPGLWDDQDRARQVTSELVRIRDDVEVYDRLLSQLDDAEVLADMAREEGDASQEPEIAASLADAAARLSELELRSLFIGEHDDRDAFVSINAKDGGTDAQDWAEILLRMYSRWAERRGFAVEVDDVSEGQEAGILSADLRIKGRYAYGLLQAERGVHRLVRISPFDANARRQTSFAGVTVAPALEAAEMPVIDEKDLRVDYFRSSGAGGQHINKTSSAVRITHNPSGVVVTCQNQRSQRQNYATAMENLASILAARAEQEHEEKLAAIQGRQAAVGWGSQIRSYVLQPYQMVKDLRTAEESGNVSGVLDGDLDRFMEAYLRWRRTMADEVPA